MNATISSRVAFTHEGKNYQGTILAKSPRYYYVEVEVGPKGTKGRFSQTDDLGSTILIEQKQVKEIVELGV